MVNLDQVPDDVAPAQFMAAMIEQIVSVTPVIHHVPVRELRERRKIAVPEPEGGTDDTALDDLSADDAAPDTLL